MNSLKRQIGLLTAISIVVGSAIGSGIFKKPAVMASQLGSPTLLIMVWIIAGVLTLFGSLSNAEIASMYPETGGQYFFFKQMYGDFFSYLYGWAALSVIQTGSIASIAFIFSESLGHLFQMPHFFQGIENSWVIHLPFIGNIFPLANFSVKLVAIALVIFLTLINYLGVALGGMVQTVLTTFKIIALASLIVFAFFSDGSFEHFQHTLPTLPVTGRGLFAAIIAALSGAFWAYDGWNNVTFVAGEIVNPQKNLPRALFVGTCTVIFIYVLINIAFVYVLPFDTLAHSHLVAADVANASMGSVGRNFVLAAILISTFGACNGSLMASARVYFAMAREKVFFSSIGNIQRRWGTPGNSLKLQCFWTSLLIMSGTFDTLTDMLIFVTWIFYGAGAYGIFVMRKKRPEIARPYRVWGYPWVTAAFVLFASVFVVETLLHDIQSYVAGETTIINSVFGLFLVALGCPLYWYFKQKPENA